MCINLLLKTVWHDWCEHQIDIVSCGNDPFLNFSRLFYYNLTKKASNHRNYEKSILQPFRLFRRTWKLWVDDGYISYQFVDSFKKSCFRGIAAFTNMFNTFAYILQNTGNEVASALIAVQMMHWQGPEWFDWKIKFGL